MDLLGWKLSIESFGSKHAHHRYFVFKKGYCGLNNGTDDPTVLIAIGKITHCNERERMKENEGKTARSLSFFFKKRYFDYIIFECTGRSRASVAIGTKTQIVQVGKEMRLTIGPLRAGEKFVNPGLHVQLVPSCQQHRIMSTCR